MSSTEPSAQSTKGRKGRTHPPGARPLLICPSRGDPHSPENPVFHTEVSPFCRPEKPAWRSTRGLVDVLDSSALCHQLGEWRELEMLTVSTFTCFAETCLLRLLAASEQGGRGLWRALRVKDHGVCSSTW